MTKLKGLNRIRKSLAKQKGLPKSTGNPILDNLRNGNVNYDNQFYGTNDDRGGIVDDSMFLTGMENPNTNVTDGGIAELKAQRQPWIAKAAAGVGRVGTKTIAEIAKMPGVVGGIAAGTAGQIGDLITGKDETDFMQTAFNNEWVKAINGINEHINEEALPVYVRKAVKDGTLWDNFTSIDFWATEGADGLGYIISMLAPGAAINRLKLGSKIFQGLSEYNMLGSKVDDAAQVLNKFGITPKNIDLGTATVANTLFEAGAEAQGAMEGYTASLKQQLNDGDITAEQFEELNKKASTVGRNVFVTNAAILLGPNAMMSKMLWGGATNKIRNSIKTVDGKIVQEAPTTLGRVGTAAKHFGTGVAREGFFEEGMQSAAEQHFTHNPDASLTDYALGDFVTAYSDMLQTTEGQKAILLGSIFGGGMVSVGNTKREIADEQSFNSLVDIANQNIDTFQKVFNVDIYERDENDKIIYETNPETGEKTPKYDPTKIKEKLEGLNSAELESLRYDKAAREGDVETMNLIRDNASTSLILPFLFNDKLGLGVLEQHLRDSAETVKLAENENVDTTAIITQTMEKAKRMKANLETFSDFAPSIVKIMNEEASSKEIQQFYQQMSIEYLTHKEIKTRVNEMLASKQKQLDSVLEERGSNRDKFESDKVHNAALKVKDDRISMLSDNIKYLEKKKEALEEKDDEFWNKQLINDRFDKFKKENDKLKQEVEEESKKSDEALKNIEDAKTPDEVDDAANGLDTKDAEKLAEEKAAVKTIVDKINANPSLDNLRNALNDLHNLKISTHSIDKVLESIEKRIADRIKAQEKFADYLAQLDETLTRNYRETAEKLESLRESIAIQVRRRKKIQQDLDNQDKSPKGRNAKILKDLIAETEAELTAIDKTIDSLRKEKLKLEKQVIAVEKDLGNIKKASEFIANRFSQIEQLDFTSVDELIEYIKTNSEYFKDHRFDIQRLLTNKFYTEQNIQALEESIEALDQYRDVLVDTLEKYRKLKGEQHPDTQFLRKELLKTEKDLFEKRQELKAEVEKHKRLAKAAIHKQVLSELTEELQFWEGLQKTKMKNKPSKAFNNPVVNLAALDKKQRLAEEKKKKELAKKAEAKKAKELAEELADAKAEGILDAVYYYDYVVNNMDIGEQIPDPPADFGVPKNVAKKEGGYFLKKITDNSITISKDGSTFTKFRDSIDGKTPKNVKTNSKDKFTPLHNTEGGLTTKVIEEGENLPKDKEGNVIEETLSVINNDAKAITGTDQDANLSFVSPEMISFERAPRNKKGEVVKFEINKEYTKGKQGEALKLLDKETLTNEEIEFLINHLPINAVFTEDAKAPLETYNENKKLTKAQREEYNKTFDKTSKDLRTAIVKEMVINKTPISNITTTIAGQKPGSIQVAPKVNDKVAENSVLDLYELGGEMSNLKSENVYVVNDNGLLVNYLNQYLDLGRKGAPGEIYLHIHTANGNSFPLKLNTAKVKQNEAELLYEIYKHRFEVGIDKGKAQPIVDTNDTIINLVKEVFKTELAEGGLFAVNKKPLEDLTIKDVVDFLVWDGTTSKKSQIRFQNKHFKLMDGTYTKEQFLKSKDAIIKRIVKDKRRNVFFKRGSDQDANSFNFNNRTYVEYVFKNKIINTNALVGKDAPTFQGDTSLYLKTNNVKVEKGPDKVLSNFNQGKKVTYKDNVRGTKSSLRRTEKGLFQKELALVGEDYYQEKNKPDSTKFKRVTYVTADKQSDLSAARYYNAAKRGDVVDALLRDFFSVGYKNEAEFVADAKKKLDQVNKDKTKHGDIFISDNAFRELYAISKEYEIEFQRRGYTIYSTTNPLYGKLRKNKKVVDTAGSMDLLAKDKYGRYVIIDIKTSTLDRAEDYAKGEKDSYYLLKDKKQQNAYAELFRQRTHKDVSKILILPITATASKTEGETNSVYRNFTRTKQQSAFIEVDMSQNIFELMGEKPITSKDTSIPGSSKSSKKKSNRFTLDGLAEQAPSLPETEISSEEAGLEFSEADDFATTLDNMFEESFGDTSLEDFVKSKKKSGKIIGKSKGKKSAPKAKKTSSKPSTKTGAGVRIDDTLYIAWGDRKVTDKETGKEITDEKLINYIEVKANKVSHTIVDIEGDQFAVTDNAIIDMTDFDRGAIIDREDSMGQSILRRADYKKSGKSPADALKSQKKDVSLQKGKELEETGVDNLTEEQAKSFVTQFVKVRSLPTGIKRDIRAVLKKSVNSKEKLKNILEIVNDQIEANDDVKKICKNI